LYVCAFGLSLKHLGSLAIGAIAVDLDNELEVLHFICPGHGLPVFKSHCCLQLYFISLFNKTSVVMYSTSYAPKPIFEEVVLPLPPNVIYLAFFFCTASPEYIEAYLIIHDSSHCNTTLATH